LDCQVYKKYKAKSADFLIDMFKEKTTLYLWQSESNVLKTTGHTVRERMFVGTGIGENSGFCDREQTDYGFRSDCAVLWG